MKNKFTGCNDYTLNGITSYLNGTTSGNRILCPFSYHLIDKEKMNDKMKVTVMVKGRLTTINKEFNQCGNKVFGYYYRKGLIDNFRCKKIMDYLQKRLLRKRDKQGIT